MIPSKTARFGAQSAIKHEGSGSRRPGVCDRQHRPPMRLIPSRSGRAPAHAPAIWIDEPAEPAFQRFLNPVIDLDAGVAKPLEGTVQVIDRS